MKAEIKAKWIAALRGGLFKQGRGALRTVDNSCCCLGVLCDIVDPKGWAGSGTADYRHRGNQDKPRSSLLNEAGLPHGYVQDLIEMNDGRGRNFEQIANWIEQNIPTE